jgi:hypothetical protein
MLEMVKSRQVSYKMVAHAALPWAFDRPTGRSLMRPFVVPRGSVIPGAAAGSVIVILWLCWPKKSSERQEASVSVPAGSNASQGTAEAKGMQPDFSALPPRDRIMAETRWRVEEAAAWREKLRSGDQTTLPPEAYPQGVPLHPAAPRQ